MQMIIHRVLDKIDRHALENELGFLRDKDSELDAIKEDVRIAKKDVSFWDRVNVFTKTDEEQVLKQYKRALKESRRDYAAIIHNIKELIREAIDLDPYVRLKIYLGEIANDVERLRVQKKRGGTTEANISQFEIHGIDEVFRGIDQMDMLLAEESGIRPGKMDEAAVVGLIYDDILRSAGFIR